MAIRYVVVPTASAPRPLGGVERPAPVQVTDTLADQLDLAVQPVNPAYTVYRNEAALPTPAMVPPGVGQGTAFDVVADDLDDAEPVLPERVGPTTRAGDVAARARILHASAASDRWELLVEGRRAPTTKLFGWAQGFEPTTGGDAVLRYDTAPVRYGVLAFQAFFWLVAIHFARRLRRRVPAGAAATPDPTAGPEPPPIEPTPAAEPEQTDWLAPAEEWPADPTPELLHELEDEPAAAEDEEQRP